MVPIEPIHPDAGERRDEEHGNLADEPHESEHHRRLFRHRFSAEPIDEPARGDDRQPGADERKNLPGKEKTIVAVPQSSSHEADFFGSEAQISPLRSRRSDC